MFGGVSFAGMLSFQIVSILFKCDFNAIIFLV